MANAVYGKGREAFAGAEIDWSGDDIKVALVRVGGGVDVYAVDIDVDEFLDDIPAAAIVATSANLSGKTRTLGVCDAADLAPAYTAVAADEDCVLVIYQDTGSGATSRLIAYIDTGTGLEVAPNGNDINITWSGGASRIFKL